MTTMRAPYRTVDILVLCIDQTQICSVVEDQIPEDTHVKILRSGQKAPELVRNEDVMLLNQRQEVQPL